MPRLRGRRRRHSRAGAGEFGRAFEAAGVVRGKHDGRVTDEQIERAGRKIGLAPADARRSAENERPWWRQPKFLALAAGGVLLVAGLALEHLLGQAQAALVPYAATIVVAGFYPLRSPLQGAPTCLETVVVVSTRIEIDFAANCRSGCCG